MPLRKWSGWRVSLTGDTITVLDASNEWPLDFGRYPLSAESGHSKTISHDPVRWYQKLSHVAPNRTSLFEESIVRDCGSV